MSWSRVEEAQDEIEKQILDDLNNIKKPNNAFAMSIKNSS